MNYLMMKNSLIKLEEEYIKKLSDLQVEFDEKIMNLKKEFISKSTSLMYKDNSFHNNIITDVFDTKYILLNDNKILQYKDKYKNSTRHIYYSLNVLIEKYLYCYNNGLHKGAVRWFRQLLTYYPNDVSKFISTHKNFMVDEYEIILEEFAYTKA